MESKTYPLFMSPFDKVMIFGMLGIFTAGGLFLLLGSPFIPAKGGSTTDGYWYLLARYGEWGLVLAIVHSAQNSRS